DAADHAAALEALGQTEERYPYLTKSWCQIIFLVAGADALPEHRRMAVQVARVGRPSTIDSAWIASRCDQRSPQPHTVPAVELKQRHRPASHRRPSEEECPVQAEV